MRRTLADQGNGSFTRFEYEDDHCPLWRPAQAGYAILRDAPLLARCSPGLAFEGLTRPQLGRSAADSAAPEADLGSTKF